MIKILISGPQGSRKSTIAKMFLKSLRLCGFVNVAVYTTNMDISIPDSANREYEN